MAKSHEWQVQFEGHSEGGVHILMIKVMCVKLKQMVTLGDLGKVRMC